MRSHNPQSFDFDEEPENVWPKSAVEAADQMRDVLALFIRISEEFDMSTTAEMLRHTVDTARQDALSKSGLSPHIHG
jgi:hypothetical protein